MEKHTLVRYADDERRDVVDFLRSLSPEEWQAPSLCAGWRVHDVATHMCVDAAFREFGTVGTILKMVRLRMNIDRINALWVDHCKDWTPERIIGEYATEDAGKDNRSLGDETSLRAVMVHHADMSRALGRPDTAPPERIQALLDVLTTPGGSANLGSIERMVGLRFVANDLEWSHGNGPEVRGPAMSLALAVSGRDIGLTDLTGDGLLEFATRVRVPVTPMTFRQVVAFNIKEALGAHRT